MRVDHAKLREKLAPTLALTRAMLKDIADRNGTLWKEAVGELHSQYNEIVLWVLLYEDSDLLEAHTALCETLGHHMDALAPLQIELVYEVQQQEKAFGARLSGNEAVFSAGRNGKMELRWFPSKLSTVFTSQNSRRTR